MMNLSEFIALDEKYCASFKIADPPPGLDKNIETEVLLFVYSDMERLIDECRVRRFIKPFSEGGEELKAFGLEKTQEFNCNCLPRRQKELWLLTEELLEKTSLDLVKQRISLEETVATLDHIKDDLKRTRSMGEGDEKAQLLRELEQRKMDWENTRKEILSNCERFDQEKFNYLQELSRLETQAVKVGADLDKDLKKAYNVARAGVNKILEEYRGLGKTFPLLLNIMHSTNNYSRKDPILNADPRGIYENIRKVLFPRGTLGKITVMARTVNKVFEMRSKGSTALEIWNYAVRQKDIAENMTWQGLTNCELFAMIVLQGLNKETQKGFIQYAKMKSRTKEDRGNPIGGALDSFETRTEDGTSMLSDDHEVDYLSEIGQYLQDYVRESTLMGNVLSQGQRNTAGNNTNGNMRAGTAKPGVHSRISNESFQMETQVKSDQETSANPSGDPINKEYQKEAEKTPKDKGKICYNWQKFGNCRYGNRCHFMHNGGQEQKAEGGGRDIPFTGYINLKEPVKKDAYLVKSVLPDNKIRVALDSQSGVNLTMETQRCSLVKPTDEALMINGVGGAVEAKLEGEMTANGVVTKFAILEENGRGKRIPTILSVGRYLKDKPKVQDDVRFVLLTPNGGIRGSLDRVRFNALESMANQSKVDGLSVIEHDVFNEYWSVPIVNEVQDNLTCESCKWKDNVVNECDGKLENEDDVVAAEEWDEAGDVDDGGDEMFDIMNEEDVSGAVHNEVFYIKFGSRPIYHDTVDEAVGYLAHCGLSAKALCSIIQNNSLDHFPKAISLNAVKKHFREVGVPVEKELAQITKTRLSSLMQSERSSIVGEVFQIDSVEPDFSKMPEDRSFVVNSVGGYNRALIAVCEASGFCFVEGMKISEKKHVIMERILLEISLKFPNVTKIKADGEWASKECRELYAKCGLLFEVSPTYDHRSNTGLVESTLRRMQELGQMNMNNLAHYVGGGEMSDKQRVKLWYHAMMYARMIMLLYPAFNDETKTRYEVGYGRKPDLNSLVLMPFGATLVARLPQSELGRGGIVIYIGPSLYMRGGIYVYNLSTSRVQSSWSFKPINGNNTLKDINVQSVYRDICRSIQHSVGEQEMAGESTASSQAKEQTVKLEEDNVKNAIQLTENNVENNVYVVKHVSDHEYEVLLAELEDVTTYIIEDNRPLKPIIPKRSEIYKYPRWKDGIKREIEKLFKSGTLKKRDYSIKANVVMELIPVFEYKWKPDPKTGVMCWLECCRIVINGSTDTREHENVYAETPEQVVTLTNLDVSAKQEESNKQSDATRAYLQAEQTEEGVVVSPCSVLRQNGLDDKEYDVGTALYGDRLAALQWEMKAEEGLIGAGSVKCITTRSTYYKELPNNSVIRIVRHSDDFLFCGVNEENKDEFNKFIVDLRSRIIMEEPKDAKRLLGFEISRYNYDGVHDEYGQIIIITMADKIERLYLDYKDEIEKWNTKGNVRFTPGPTDIMRQMDDDKLDSMDELLNSNDHSLFRSILGKLMYISISYRHDVRFTVFALSLRSTKPRKWDLKCALWCVEYIHRTKELPLVLGGDEDLSLLTFSDATLATAYEGRSVRGHFIRLSESSGAVYASVHCLKCAVKAVFHPELASCADGVETGQFLKNILTDFKVKVNGLMPTVMVDNEAVVKWLNGDKYNAKTRGLDALFYSIRHMVQEELVEVKHVSGENNPSDVLTKILPRELHWKHLRDIMGLKLLAKIDNFKHLSEMNHYYDE